MTCGPRVGLLASREQGWGLCPGGSFNTLLPWGGTALGRDCGKEWGLQSQPSALEREEGEFLLEGVAQPQGWTRLGAVREAESRLFAG